jgi:hypothetical protein
LCFAREIPEISEDVHIAHLIKISIPSFCVWGFFFFVHFHINAAVVEKPPRESILLAYRTTTALSGAECAGNLLGLWVGVAPAAQLEGLRPSKPPRKLYCRELSGFVPPVLPESCTIVSFQASFLQSSPKVALS